MSRITDVPGVRVAHRDPGLTVLLPYPRTIARRKLWGAFRSEGRIGEVSGLHVLRDFGTLSSPIVFCPLAWFGSVYDALIEDGFRRDHDLSIDAGWPPIVFGLPTTLGAEHADPPTPVMVQSALERAEARFATGGVGAARPAPVTQAGSRHGIGTSSEASPAGHIVGALAACLGDLQIAILATDAPLSPLALGRLAEQALRGMQGEEGTAVLAFTTAQGVEGAFQEQRGETRRRQVPPEERAALGRSAVSAVRQSALSALA